MTLCLALWMTSCVDEDHFRPGNGADPDYLYLDLNATDMTELKAGSRAETDAKTERAVKSVTVVVFRWSESKGDYERFKIVDSKIEYFNTEGTLPAPAGNIYARAPIARSEFQSGYQYAFAVLVNMVESSDTWKGGGSSLLEDFRNSPPGTFNGFKSWDVYIRQRSAQFPANKDVNVIHRPDEGFLMTGTTDGVTINSATKSVIVDVKRVDAKIRFEVEGVDNDELKTLITLKKWRVHNVPIASKLFDVDNGNVEAERQDVSIYTVTPENEEFSWQTFDHRTTGTVYTPGTELGEQGTPLPADKGDFTFYMPETMNNQKNPQKEINPTAWKGEYEANPETSTAVPTYQALYGMRTRQAKSPVVGTATQAYSNGDFIYAPQKATWVEIVADVVQFTKNADGTWKRWRANDAVFRVVLGGGKSPADDGGKTDAQIAKEDPDALINTDNGVYKRLNDYTVKRNTFYTYKVKIQNLYEAYVEVVENQVGGYGSNVFEANSGIDAHILENPNRAILDSHYDQQAILLNIYDLMNQYVEEGDWVFNKGKDFDYEVSTPYASYFNSTVGNNPRDENWLEFVQHARFKLYPNEPDFYPHIALPYEYAKTVYRNKDMWTKGPKAFIDQLKALLNRIKSRYESLPGHQAFTSTVLKEDSDFRRILREENVDDATGDIIYTCFVNEYYYQQRPVPDAAHRGNMFIQTNDGQRIDLSNADSYTWARNGWRTFVNRPDRYIRFYIGRDKLFSSDGQSSFSKPLISVTQHAIIAPYDLNSLPLDYTGFGLESTDETEWMDDYGVRGEYSVTFRGTGYANYVDDSDYTTWLDPFDGAGWSKMAFGSAWLEGGKTWNTYLDYVGDNLRHPLCKINYYQIANNGATPSTLAKKLLKGPRTLFREARIYNRKQNRTSASGDFAGLAILMRNRETQTPDAGIWANLSIEDVHWYIPTLAQMEQIGMCMPAIPTYARFVIDAGEDGRAPYTPGSVSTPYLTSSAQKSSLEQSSELLMYQAKNGTTLRHSMAVANWGLYRPYADDITRLSYYYVAFPERDRARPLRLRAARTLGVYNPGRIYRPIRRFIGRSYFTSWGQDTYAYNTMGQHYDFAPIVLDASALPQNMRRQIVIRNRALPRHTLNSIYARPFKAFRVANVSIQTDKKLRGYGYDDWHYLDYTEAQNNPYGRPSWEAMQPVTLLDDSKDQHPCKRYYEYNASGQKITGWRLPNAGELMLMLRYIPPQYQMDLRKYNHSALYQTERNGWMYSDNANWTMSGNRHKVYETLRTNVWQFSYVLSKTDLSEDQPEGYTSRIYAADFWARGVGIRAKPMDKSEFMARVKERYPNEADINYMADEEAIRITGGVIGATRFDVRCVKDLTEEEYNGLVQRGELDGKNFVEDNWWKY